MHEPLTTSLLLSLIADLNVAFPSNRASQNAAALADVYRNGLTGLSGESLREAVRRCIQSEEYFPKVSKLRAIASEYDRRRTINVRDSRNDPDECPVCGARAIQREIGRDEHDQPIREQRATMTHDARRHGVHDSNQEHAA